MPYDLAALDRIEQRFVRRGTSLFVETYNMDTLAVLDSFEFTNAPLAIPSEVRAVAQRRLLDIVSPVSGAGVSWAALPVPAAYQGLQFVSDVGVNGSLWRSNGTTWSLVGGSCVLGQSAVAVSCTASTAEEVLQSVSIPAGVIGINGALRLATLWTCTGAVGTKTLRARLGATALGGSAWLAIVRSAAATDYVDPIPQVLRCRNAANSQIVYSPANGHTSTATGTAPSTFTEDTSAALVFALTGQKATAGEVLTLEGYTLELLR